MNVSRPGGAREPELPDVDTRTPAAPSAPDSSAAAAPARAGETSKTKDAKRPSGAPAAAPPAARLPAAKLGEAIEKAFTDADGEKILYMSESDYPYEFAAVKNPRKLPLTGENVMKLFQAKLVKDVFAEDVNERDFEKDLTAEVYGAAESKRFLKDNEKVDPDLDEHYRVEAAAWKKVNALLDANLSDVRVVKIGPKDEDDPTKVAESQGLYAYMVVGKTKDGEAAAIYYGAVET
jgi:hypothetical protein